jgi:hypothetical protein
MILSFNKYPVISFYIYEEKFFLANINNEFEVYKIEELGVNYFKIF